MDLRDSKIILFCFLLLLLLLFTLGNVECFEVSERNCSPLSPSRCLGLRCLTAAHFSKGTAADCPCYTKSKKARMALKDISIVAKITSLHRVQPSCFPRGLLWDLKFPRERKKQSIEKVEAQ